MATTESEHESKGKAKPNNKRRTLGELASASSKKRKTATKTRTIRFKVTKLDAPRFRADDPASFQAARTYLDEHGFAIFEKAASPGECKHAKDLFMQYLAECSEGRIDAKDPKTWSNANWPEIQSIGMLCHFGISQCDAARFCRTLPGIRLIWERFWGTSQLLACLGSWGAFRGAEHNKTKFKRDWLHTDQSPRILPRLDFSFQGILNLLDCMEPDDHGSFLCIPGSHKVMLERFRQGQEPLFNQPWKGQCELSKDHWIYQQAQRDHPARALCLREGDFLIFNSMLVHCTHAPATDTIKGQLRRLVAKIAMQPTAARCALERRARELKAPTGCKQALDYEMTDEDRKARPSMTFWQARLKASREAWTTTHWAQIDPANRTLKRGRHKAFNPLIVPKQCLRDSWTDDELALLLGLDPRDRQALADARHKLNL